MQDEIEWDPNTGRGYKLTTFSKEHAENHGRRGRHWLALFEKGETSSTTGWDETNKARALKHAKAFISTVK